MSNILAAAVFLVISQFAISEELVRSRVYSSGLRETITTTTGYAAQDPIGQMRVAQRITEKFSGEVIRGKPKEPLEAMVMVDVTLDSKGGLISAKLFRGGAITSIHDQRAVDMVRNSAPFGVPTYYKGGKFLATFLFEERPHATARAKFIMEILNREH